MATKVKDSKRRDVIVTITATYRLNWTEPEVAAAAAFQRLQGDVRRGALNCTFKVAEVKS